MHSPQSRVHLLIALMATLLLFIVAASSVLSAPLVILPQPTDQPAVVQDVTAVSTVVMTAVAADESWADHFGYPGLLGTVNAIAMDGDSLYVGGYFSLAGRIEAHNIARWDGRRWHPLGDGVNDTVTAIVVKDGTVYVGGAFTQAGNLAVNGIARWTGSAWQQVGSGAGVQYSLGSAGRVNALALLGDDLYIGGQFDGVNGVAAASVARWDGTAWQPLGRGVGGNNYNGTLSSGEVYTLGTDGDGSLVVGGRFGLAGNGNADLTVNSIARWDPTPGAWVAYGEGMSTVWGAGNVYALALADGKLYAGGDFSSAGGNTIANLAVWDGDGWGAVGIGGNTVGKIHALVVTGKGLYVGGEFTTIDGVGVNGLAHWNGADWAAVANAGLQNYDKIYALAMGGDGDLYAGGSFWTLAALAVNNIAQLDGDTWRTLGQGFADGAAFSANSAFVNAVASAEGEIIAGGQFSHAGGLAAPHIAAWDGSRWSALGSGASGSVHAIAVDGSNVYVGGTFTEIGGISANHVARWNRTTRTWHALGTGINGNVYALAVAADGALYAGGSFSGAGSATAYDVARWDGTAWAPIGDLFFSNGQVRALAVAGSNLFIGGSFVQATVDGQTVRVNGLLLWDSATGDFMLLGEDGHAGVTVETAGLEIGGTVYALHWAHDRLYVGGDFAKAGGVAAAAIASYDPTNRWEPLDGGVGHTGTIRPEVRALASAGSALFASGLFESAGGVSTRSGARWDAVTQQWSGLAGGVAGRVNALTVAGPALYVGGSFNTAGGAPAAAFGLWGKAVLRTSVTAASGGLIESGDGVRLQFPAGAVTQDTMVSYQGQMAPAVDLRSGDRLLRSFTLAAHAAGAGTVTGFANSYTLRLPYTDAELAAFDLEETSLSLVYWNGAHWIEMLPCSGCSVDTATNSITVLADQIGEFALVGSVAPPPAGADATLYLPSLQN